MAKNERDLPLLFRLWQYQKERFSIVKHGLLIAAFSASAVCLSALLRGQTDFPGMGAFAVSFIVLFTLFFQLRIADEFKDAEEDALYRPERAVPRGLISLRELAGIGILTAILQLMVVTSLSLSLLPILLMIWVYMSLMSAEFFAPAWLKARPLLYMVSHMLIMPLIDLFATACDWLVQEHHIPDGLIWFLIVSFFNGVIIEIGRKTWAPSMERQGVETYSAAWGLKTALLAWMGAVVASLICAVIVSFQTGFVIPAVSALIILAALMARTAWLLLKHQEPAHAKRLEDMSGLWLICIYLFLGIIPMGVSAWL